MAHVTFILDLTAGTRDAAASVAACRALDDADWDLRVAWADAHGARTADLFRTPDGAVTACRAGSGTGVCAWSDVVAGAAGPWIVFLHPGDRVRPDALAAWQRALARRDRARWAIAAAAGAPYNDWWFQGDTAESAAALLATGASFPECAAIVHRDVWAEAAATLPESVDDGRRASAWLALALAHTPALLPEVVAETTRRPAEVPAERLAVVLQGLARRDGPAVGRLMADVARLASGMRIAQDTLFEALATAQRCFGRVPTVRLDPGDWRRRTRLFEALVSRGHREVWIWGAGQLGLEARDWLQARHVPIAGFLDSQPDRDGTRWGGLVVRHGPSVCTGRAETLLVVIASMHHAAIAAPLEAEGWHEGQAFAVFAAAQPWLGEDGSEGAAA